MLCGTQAEPLSVCAKRRSGFHGYTIASPAVVRPGLPFESNARATDCYRRVACVRTPHNRNNSTREESSAQIEYRRLCAVERTVTPHRLKLTAPEVLVVHGEPEIQDILRDGLHRHGDLADLQALSVEPHRDHAQAAPATRLPSANTRMSRDRHRMGNDTRPLSNRSSWPVAESDSPWRAA
jgi:hypothetical protein